MKKRSLIMLSGGIDSTAILFEYLKNKKDVWVHHVALKNRENRWELEGKACDQIIAYCREHFKECRLEYTTSTYEFLHPRFGYDTIVVHFIATQILRNIPDCFEVVIGHNKEDFEDGSFMMRFTKAQKVFNAALDTQVNFQFPIKLNYPYFPDVSKKELWDLLPSGLRACTVTCRTPQHGKKCGQCKSCKQMKRLGIIEPE